MDFRTELQRFGFLLLQNSFKHQVNVRQKANTEQEIQEQTHAVYKPAAATGSAEALI